MSPSLRNEHGILSLHHGDDQVLITVVTRVGLLVSVTSGDSLLFFCSLSLAN